jgi:hypothetical protein
MAEKVFVPAEECGSGCEVLYIGRGSDGVLKVTEVHPVVGWEAEKDEKTVEPIWLSPRYDSEFIALKGVNGKVAVSGKGVFESVEACLEKLGAEKEAVE